MLSKDLLRHKLEFARAVDQHQYEVTDTGGILFPNQKVIVAGSFATMVNGADRQVDPNIVPVAALDYLLKLGLTGVGGASNWYIAPFVNNVTPLSTLTAATFTATLGEFDDYDEVTRQALVLPADPTAGSYSNAASPAVFTAAAAVGTGAGVDVYGAGVLSVSTKNATTGVLFSASLFAGARNLKTGDRLTTEYEVNATSA